MTVTSVESFQAAGCTSLFDRHRPTTGERGAAYAGLASAARRVLDLVIRARRLVESPFTVVGLGANAEAWVSLAEGALSTQPEGRVDVFTPVHPSGARGRDHVYAGLVLSLRTAAAHMDAYNVPPEQRERRFREALSRRGSEAQRIHDANVRK